jgi:hypothetical protein
MTLKEFLEIKAWLKDNPNIKVEIIRNGDEAELRLFSITEADTEYITIGLPIFSDSALN